MTTQEALQAHKYGGLEKWRDLFFYMRHCGDPKQMHEIAMWARRFNHGELVVLPLINNVSKTLSSANVHSTQQRDIVKDAEDVFGVHEVQISQS